MPTENRSSNTEMVSDLLPCPFCGEKPQITKHHREDIYSFMHRCQVLGPISWGFREDQQAHVEKWNARAQSAPQPHPEPIAWMVGTAIWWTKEEAERDAAATGLPIVGMGPMTGIAPAERYQVEPVACSHEWTDDGEFLLVCTKCGAQENHDPKWRDMATAPRDGTLVRLLVEFTEHATEDSDAMPSPTIGANSFDHTGDDVWQFAGWSWEQDCFTQGAGEPVGWLPMLDTPCAEPAAPAEIDHDALVAAVCVLRSQGLGNLSEAVETARAALERTPS